MRKVFGLFLVFVLFCPSAFGQRILPSGHFDRDTFKLGEHVNYSLSVRYPKNQDVVFPDSTYSFAPFEFISKISAPTVSDSLFSFDRAIYELASYEIDSIQYLSLPIFVVSRGDSVQIRPTPDSLILFHLVEAIPDSIALLESTGYNPVDLNFNYPYLIVAVTSVILIALIIFFAFGKQIRQKILLYRLDRKHRKFIEDFTSQLGRLREDVSASDMFFLERMLVKWKSYMERLNQFPFTKLTTKEILERYSDKQLQTALASIDKVIYGGIHSVTISDYFDYLRRVSDDSYHQKVTEIKSGK